MWGLWAYEKPHTLLLGNMLPLKSERGRNVQILSWRSATISCRQEPEVNCANGMKLISERRKEKKKKSPQKKLLKPEAWNVLLEKNHSITSSCGMITMIYEAEVISSDCASGRLVSHDLWSQAMGAEEEPHMFHWGSELASSRGFQGSVEGEGKLLPSDPWTPFSPPTSSLGGHTALLCSFLLKVLLLLLCGSRSAL